ALPGVLFAHLAGGSGFVLVGRFRKVEGTVSAIAAARGRLGADHAQDTHVVLKRWDSGFGGVTDHLADVVDLAVPLGALAQHDVRVFRLRDVRGTQRQRHAIELDAVRFDAFAQLRQTLYGQGLVELRRRQRAADVIHAERCQDGQNGVGETVCVACRRLYKNPAYLLVLTKYFASIPGSSHAGRVDGSFRYSKN